MTLPPQEAETHATDVRLYEPFSALPGQVRVNATIAREVGNCFSNATNSPRDDGRRCFGVKSFVHDPCFAAFSNRATPTVCPDAPWGSEVILMAVKENLGPLPVRTGGQQPVTEASSVGELGGARAAWAVELANGDRCLATTGGTRTPRAAFAQVFDCKSGAVIAGAIDDAAAVWRVNYFRPRAEASTLVGVKTAWL